MLFKERLMPSLPHNPHSYASGLRSYLESALPASRLTEASVTASYDPLLLLKTDHVLAAFAFSNGDVRESYKTIYESFKKYYIEQKGQWDRLDLAFVFCVRPEIPNLDDFCSTVETDVYFCRKFVVPLAPPLGASLARLPFLPLTPLNGQSLRPPSAQTFLQRCGVPAVLAKYLVVQRERGPQKIVEDCINGDFGDPNDLTPVTSTPVVQPEPGTEPIRLDAVTIKNFRAYRKPQTFAFGTDVTVLYGANGFGKTSFFDAVDFAATGEIGRIKPHGDQHFRKMAPHLDSTPEESTVSLSFWCNGALRKIARSVSDRKRAMLDGISIDRKGILAELTGGDFPAADRVENFVSLFRATHLFNQEQQELTKDFQDDCRLPSEIVARMLAFEDYASALSKAAKVREVLERVIGESTAQINDLSEQIADEKKELERLGKTVKEGASSETLETELQALRRAVGRLGIAVESEKINPAVVRGWRASLEAGLTESQSRTERLSVLAKEVAGIPQTNADLVRLQEQIAEKDRTLANAEEKRITAEAEFHGVEHHVADVNRLIAEAQARAHLIEWVRVMKPEYAALLEHQRAISAALNRTIDSLSQDRKSEESTASDLRKHDDLALQWVEQLKRKRADLAAVETLSNSIDAWRGNSVRLKALPELEEGGVKLLDSLRAEAGDLAPKAAATAVEEKRVSRQVADAEKSQSELKNLVSQLVGHVQTGTCPLCGEDHGSRNELVRRIERHVSLDVASAARTSLNDLREQANKLAEQTTQNLQKQRVVEAQITELKEERTKLDAEISRVVGSGERLGIVLDAPGPAVTKRVNSLRTQIQKEIEELDRQIKEASALAEGTRIALRNLRALMATKTIELNEQKAALNRVQNQVTALRDDPRAIQVSLDIGDEQLKELERIAYGQLSEFRSNSLEVQNEATQKQSALSALLEETATLRKQLSSLRTQLATLQRVMSQLTAQLEQMKLPSDATEQLLLNRIGEESKIQAQILSLRDSASNLELALDTATTSAALTQLRQNVRSKEKVVSASTRTRDQRQPWIKYFTDLSRLVSSQQSEAIANFTREYGPRTSVIQRRLRSVYGFDELEITSHESEIRVRVKRHGEVLRPTDFFSQSQQQTLFLGLFLTACISQTWSAFSPVFLDDPVTHFDDLNTYAFLDLIVGLLEPGAGSRQFVISTCDEKLLQLARQKFRHLGKRAKFYRFAAISEDGPIVDEVA
jgi:exonuclease SbcC